MAHIRSLLFDGWGEFKRDLAAELFDDGRHRRGRYLFRGMRSPQWRLEPTFDRAYRHLPVTARPGAFDRLVAAFAEECREFGVPAEVCDDPHRLIALGQHHGLPTRLLDWTASPYVAAYFAYESALGTDLDEDSHVVVWVLHRGSAVWSGDFGVDLISAPSSYNARARNQFGSFTLSRDPHACLEDFVLACHLDEIALTRVLLPVPDAAEALADLDLMGISALQLFPDLDGLASACATRFQLSQG